MHSVTIESVRERISYLEGLNARGVGTAVQQQQFELACLGELLATLEAEPVGWTDEQELRSVEKDGCGYLFTANPITPHADQLRVIKLYIHPPAPTVPEIVPESLRDEIIDLCAGYEIGDQGAQEIWEACRAVMLNGDKP
ncbi:hypothetical protein DEO48_08435 [Enterobacter sp. CGMCC 5087]|uniref:hypothetical protein n=1 Tax=Enterobacter sp. CGMCC 5087 TaxID=2183878 RepID=UPI000D67CFCC|nr:hypothetical protein [Enterobacter sp. CGMCC 5087]PWI80511.1 hypothetical protein DEO48_08435 [Enterobacter sp. CGMCC 5087]